MSRWLSSPESQIAWCRCGDDYLVFYRPSGKTHCLNHASNYLIEHLLQRPLTIDEIVAEFSDTGLDKNYLVEDLTDMLEHFEELGMIERQ